MEARAAANLARTLAALIGAGALKLTAAFKVAVLVRVRLCLLVPLFRHSNGQHWTRRLCCFFVFVCAPSSPRSVTSVRVVSSDVWRQASLETVQRVFAQLTQREMREGLTLFVGNDFRRAIEAARATKASPELDLVHRRILVALGTCEHALTYRHPTRSGCEASGGTKLKHL
jgi:hypothetical protein